jgi:Mycothiol maleylpyruvate isomerase N-terminal domain
MVDSALVTRRSGEAEAFLDTLQHTPPELVTACDGWTTHEVTAHMAGTAAEITRHLEPYLQGEPVPETQSFEVREAPFQAMSDAALRARLEAEEDRMRRLIDQVLAREPDADIPWTGRRMVVAKFIPHMRNEFAIHRWDFAGDGETATQLLGQPELTEHAVGVLGGILVRRGRPHDPLPDEDFHVRLRAEGATDVRLLVEDGQARLEMATDDRDEPWVDFDAAARTLVIWGRRPDQRGRFRSHVPAPMLARMQALLAGY